MHGLKSPFLVGQDGSAVKVNLSGDRKMNELKALKIVFELAEKGLDQNNPDHRRALAILGEMIERRNQKIDRSALTEALQRIKDQVGLSP